LMALNGRDSLELISVIVQRSGPAFSEIPSRARDRYSYETPEVLNRCKFSP
jgi:hypothetical protein